jgi:hypothetical protein
MAGSLGDGPMLARTHLKLKPLIHSIMIAP